ncbi:MAG TPA: indole-3-glycerol phosphate synthase TrpC [bacterium]|nr:indole-3-glycerol phosphate synthase TrpC [bacterium]
MTRLEEIVAYKKITVPDRQRAVSFSALMKRADARKDRRDFASALCHPDRMALIAEVKKASPSAGIIREDFDPVAIARAYGSAGADALSVLTDEKFFQGSFAYLSQASAAVSVPVLCKDFIIDEYQIVEAAAHGADAVLLIASIHTAARLEKLAACAAEQHLAALVETHTPDDVKRALDAGATLVGINNRDLAAFTVDLSATESLAPLVPADRTLVSESGIKTRGDVDRLRRCGVDAALIGETFMRAKDIGAAVRDLMGTR